MSDIEYKVGQEVWLMYNNKPIRDKISSLKAGLSTDRIRLNKYYLTVTADKIAPTKEALRIKVFGE